MKRWAILIGISASALGGGSDWFFLSSRLSGHSESVRQQALQKLRAIPGIREILEKELEGKRIFHALEVISALQLVESLPQLKELAAADQTGAIFLTINSLTTDNNLHGIAQFYVETWNTQLPRLSDPASVVVLDTMGQMALCLSEGSLLSTWKSRPPEVRAAILGYVRNKHLSPKCGPYSGVLKSASLDPALQIRQLVGAS